MSDGEKSGVKGDLSFPFASLAVGGGVGWRMFGQDLFSEARFEFGVLNFVKSVDSKGATFIDKTYASSWFGVNSLVVLVGMKI